MSHARGRWEGGSGWGIHVNPWLIHVSVWQKTLQYCKVISLQLIKINEKKNYELLPCRATQDRWVMVESSEKMWSTGEGNGKPLQYSFLENPMNSMKRLKDRTLKDKLSRPVGAQYATGEEWRNNCRKNKEMEPKEKQCPVMDVIGDGSQVWCCKEQHCIGTWNVRSTNQR